MGFDGKFAACAKGGWRRQREYGAKHQFVHDSISLSEQMGPASNLPLVVGH